MGRRGHIEIHQGKFLYLPVLIFDPPSKVAFQIVKGIFNYPYHLAFDWRYNWLWTKLRSCRWKSQMNHNCNHDPVSPHYLTNFEIEGTYENLICLILSCCQFCGICLSFWDRYSVSSRSLTDDVSVIDVIVRIWCLTKPPQKSSRHKLQYY